MPAAFRRLAVLRLPVLAQAVAQRRSNRVVAELRALVEGHSGNGDDGHSENSLHKVAVSCGGGRDKRSAARRNVRGRRDFDGWDEEMTRRRPKASVGIRKQRLSGPILSVDGYHLCHFIMTRAGPKFSPPMGGGGRRPLREVTIINQAASAGIWQADIAPQTVPTRLRNSPSIAGKGLESRQGE